MNDAKYIGLDVHQATISVAVLDSAGKLVMEAVLETKAETILQFIRGLRGSLHVTFEEGTCAAWLHDLLKPHVTQVLVCDPRKNTVMKTGNKNDRSDARKNTVMKTGNKNDRSDARKLAELLYLDKLHPVYHGETGIRALKEVARSYLALTRDTTRVMNRLKALYRSWAIPCAGQRVYAPRDRSEWLAKITEAGVHRRAGIYYQQLEELRRLRQQVRRELLVESAKHQASKLLCQIPSIGPIRAAQLIAILQTPHRFRTKRQLWAYGGLAIETHSSADHRYVEGQLQPAKRQVSLRGLNRNHNHELKNIFKGAAIIAATKPGPLQEFYAALVAKGMRPEMARLTLARKIAAITLIVWKKGVSFDAEHLKPQTA